MVTELGPGLTGLMVAGRNASGMASELGSMVVTEQIDAMRALGTDPTKKLVTPRVVSTVFMLFFLTIISDLLGADWRRHRRPVCIRDGLASVLELSLANLVFRDVFTGLVKPYFSDLLSLPSAAITECRRGAGRKAWAALRLRRWSRPQF